MSKVVLLALAFWIGLCLGSTCASDDLPPRYPALCAIYHLDTVLSAERDNDMERVCHAAR